MRRCPGRRTAGQTRSRTMNDPAHAAIFAAWHDAARARDTPALLALYAPDAVLESPLVPAILDDRADGVLRGHADLARFFTEGARRRPNELVRWWRGGQWASLGPLLI